MEEPSMNPIFATVINAVLQNKRTCSNCGNNQFVPRDRRREIVICKRGDPNIHAMRGHLVPDT